MGVESIQVCSPVATVQTRQIPVRRHLATIAAYVKAHPNDPNGYYALGWLQHLAATAPLKPSLKDVRFKWGMKPDHTGLFIRTPTTANDLPVWGQRVFPDGVIRNVQPVSFRRTPNEQIDLIRQAILNLSRAIELRDASRWTLPPKPSWQITPAGTPWLFEWCVARSLEAFSDQAKEAGRLPPFAPTPDPNAWRDTALDLYKRVFDLTYDETYEPPGIGADGDAVPREVCDHWLTLVRRRRLSADESREVERFEAARKRMIGRAWPIS